MFNMIDRTRDGVVSAARWTFGPYCSPFSCLLSDRLERENVSAPRGAIVATTLSAGLGPPYDIRGRALL